MHQLPWKNVTYKAVFIEVVLQYNTIQYITFILRGHYT